MAMTWMVALTAAGFLASVTTNAIGVGGGLLVMPLLALWFPARQVVSYSTPMFLANALITLVNYRKHWKVPRTLWTIPWVLIGILIGVHFLVVVSGRGLDILIAAIALTFVSYEVYRRASGRQMSGISSWLSLPIGVLAGAVSALSNIGGTLLSLYVLSPEVTPAGFIGSLALLYVMMTGAKFGLFWFHHLLGWQALVWSLPSIPAIMLGAWAGKTLNRLIRPSIFRPLVVGVILLSSVLLLVTPG